MSVDRKVDLFWLLGQLDAKNFDLWDQLTEEQRKEVSPYMILRWLAGCNDPEQLVMLGEVANACLFEFGNKKDLMLKVLTACTASGSKRYKWTAPKGAVKSSSKALQLIADTYKMPLRHAIDVRPLFTNAEVTALAEAQGWQKDELAELKKELA
jgi:hypothetical protein